MLGVCFGWWVQHHNRHHNHPNHLELDPDILRRVAVFAPEQAQDREGFAATLAANQRYLFFPLLGLEALVLRIAGVIALRRRALGEPLLEGGLMVLHAVLFFGALFVLLPWPSVLLFLAVHQVLLGYLLGLGFAVNHKGLPTRVGKEWSWLERQVLTARTLPTATSATSSSAASTTRSSTTSSGMPRAALRRAYPLVKQFCISGISRTSRRASWSRTATSPSIWAPRARYSVAPRPRREGKEPDAVTFSVKAKAKMSPLSRLGRRPVLAAALLAGTALAAAAQAEPGPGYGPHRCPTSCAASTPR